MIRGFSDGGRHFSAGGGSPPEADKSLWLKRISNFRHLKLYLPLCRRVHLGAGIDPEWILSDPVIDQGPGVNLEELNNLSPAHLGGVVLADGMNFIGIVEEFGREGDSPVSR